MSGFCEVDLSALRIVMRLKKARNSLNNPRSEISRCRAGRSIAAGSFLTCATSGPSFPEISVVGMFAFFKPSKRASQTFCAPPSSSLVIM